MGEPRTARTEPEIGTTSSAPEPGAIRRPAPGRRGLRAKIVAWFLIPAAAISIGVALLTFYAYGRVTEELVLARNRDHTLLLANQLGTELAGYAQVLAALDSAGTIDSDALLESWYAEARLFDGGILVLDRAGKTVAAAPDRPEFEAMQAPALLVSDREPHYSNIIDDLVPGLPVIALSWPISNPNNPRQATLVGLLRAERGATRTSAFYQNVWSLYIGRRQVAYVVDGAGRVIFHPDTFLIGEDYADQDPVRRARQAQTGAMRVLNHEGQEVVAGFAPVPGTPWGLVTEESWADLMHASQPYTRFLLALLALGVLVPAAVAALGTRRITRPLTRLTQAAARIAGGSFDQVIDVHTGDELETLAHQFNAMAADLESSYATLEQRVADRTRELATLNEISAVVSRSLELEEVLEAALTNTVEALNMDAGAAFRLEGETLVMMAHQGLSAAFVRQVERLPLADSLAAYAVGERGPTSRSVAAYPDGDLKTLLQEEGLGLVVSVPLIAKDTVLGTLNLVSRAPRAITPEEQALLAAIGQQAGVAVENARLYEQAEATAAEAERIRLARELHDAVSQTLFSASMIADILPRLWARDRAEAERRLDDLRRLARGAMAEMRSLLVELRPSTLVGADLAYLLRQLAEAMGGRAQIGVDLDLGPTPPLPVEVKVALYRIAQESLNNVVKHARAGRVEVKLEAGAETVVLRIHDDGLGFDPSEVPAGHFGLDNIRERAEAIGAEADIDSAPGCGTRITVTWRQHGT